MSTEDAALPAAPRIDGPPPHLRVVPRSARRIACGSS